ncbi:MAG: UDP-N-acetylmuramate--L-alanine ligase [Paludibacteraceae bacterium]|nr:UDP-N-acetylmuramate--L-alanine ligase [Paludibacteraceae bacterium]
MQAIDTYYFLGIGGIGMSALARYFVAKGFRVMGYDRTPSPLTQSLKAEGIVVQYDDCLDKVQELDVATTVVVRTPAVPQDMVLYVWLREQGFTILKRAEVLGLITRQQQALCVAGTHGKTTTSTILAHILHSSHIGTNAFLGGIANNYDTNLLLDAKSNYVVVEADEFDRSFHHLTPYISIITSMDPDHLDIYGTEEAYNESFAHYASLVQEALVVKKNIASRLSPLDSSPYHLFTYAVDEQADFFADNIRVEEGHIYFDFHTPDTQYPISNIHLGVPVWVNIENSVAAMAVAWLVGATEEELRHGVSSFAGVFRRFNIHLNTPQITYIDDYAHHPQELAATIESVRRLYPDRYVIGVFQPHLFSRTRDFADAFAEVLSQLNEVALLPIYPAREQPIEGVNSEWLMDKMSVKRALVLPAILPKYLRERVKNCLAANRQVVVITMGAGDIDRQVNEITHKLTYKIL